MAFNLIRHLQKSYRQPSVGVKLQPCRNASNAGNNPTGPSTAQQQPRPIVPQQSIEAAPSKSSSSYDGSKMTLLLGIALGASITQLTQDRVLKRIFPEKEPPKVEKVAQTPSVDPKLMEHIISQDRKVNQLENQLSSLREDLREREQQQQQSNKSSSANAQKGGGANVFELSEVIQANNIAAEVRLTKELDEQRQSMLREHLLKVEGEILKVENKYRPIVNKIRELEVHLENQRQIQQIEAPARLLWLCCQSLMDRLRDSPQQPLENDPAYDVLRKFAANDNQFAISVLDSIPAKVIKEGVQSEETLTERFQRLEKVCKRVAMVDSHGAGLGKYLLSYMQSLFIIDKSTNSISDEEISGQKLVDPTSWTTFDILARVRYCLVRRNLEQAVRYANQLRGQARVVARDWIRDARLHLLTRQALSALSSHAQAIAVDTTRTCNSNASESGTSSFGS